MLTKEQTQELIQDCKRTEDLSFEIFSDISSNTHAIRLLFSKTHAIIDSSIRF